MTERSDDYTVGYGKPPKHSRWKPGQSGNPKGRQRGKRGIKTDLGAVIDGKQTIRIGGDEVEGSRQYLTLLTLASRAAAGDLKAAALLVPLIIQVLGTEDRGGPKSGLSAHDQALLDEMLGRAGNAEDLHRSASPLNEEE